jgi:hypothetical protein
VGEWLGQTATPRHDKLTPAGQRMKLTKQPDGLLSMLAGHRRYSHVTAIRCDGINPGLLGMRKVISEDALRNALKRIPEAEGTHKRYIAIEK